MLKWYLRVRCMIVRGFPSHHIDLPGFGEDNPWRNLELATDTLGTAANVRPKGGVSQETDQFASSDLGV